MTARLIFEHVFPISVPEFWEKIFASEDFNKALYEDHLGFRYELQEWNAKTGARRARVWPTADVPKPVAAVLGQRISFVEDGIYDREKGRYDFVVIPSTLADRIQTTGSVFAEKQGENECVRKVEIAIEARVFGIGKAIESFLEKTTRDQYESNAQFARDFLNK